VAESSPQVNNVPVKFSRKSERERRMPPVSGAQAKAMFAAKNGKSTLGIPKAVGEEFTEDLAPGDVKDLPERKAKPKKNKRAERMRAKGLISDKQADKLGME